jgi:outer membrane protein OmpA-like peptidoglycan-associated protein
MKTSPALSATEAAVLRALLGGPVSGAQRLAEAAAGCRLSADLARVHRHVLAIRALLARRYVRSRPDQGRARLEITRAGRRALPPASPRLALWFFTPVMALAASACTTAPPAAPARMPLMGYPTMTGLAQVRDAKTGEAYFVPCNPCASPTVKTLASANDPRPAAAIPRRQALEGVVDRRAVLESLAESPTPAPMPAAAQAAPAGERSPPASVAVVAATTGVAASAGTVAAQSLVAAASVPDKLAVLFASASAELDTEALDALAPLLRAAAQGGHVTIRGGADASGSTATNRTLAAKRAAAVRAAFLAAGVPAARLKVSVCATCYVAPNATQEGRRANRRADVELAMPSQAESGAAGTHKG